MEIDAVKYGDIPSMDIMEMEALLKQCPWFSYLREIMMEKLYRIDQEAFYQNLSQNAIFLSSRKRLYEKIHAPQEEEEAEKPEIIVETPCKEDLLTTTTQQKEEKPSFDDEIEIIQKPRVVVVGGDFFSKEDLKGISPEEDMELKLRNSPFYRPAEEAPEQKPESKENKASAKKSSLMTADGKVNFDDLAFCTETLGHIYAQQGFYEKAIDVFSKLILLYPQKSAYFAALINDLKNNID